MLRSVLNNHPSEISYQPSINLRNFWQREGDHFMPTSLNDAPFLDYEHPISSPDRP